MKYENLEEIKLPNNLGKNDNWAFINCKYLKRIEIPDSVKEIGNSCFLNCENLEEIKLPNNLEKIGKDAFFNCKKLKKIEIPDSVKEIGDGCFAFCENLEEIKLPNNLEKIDNHAFNNCENLKYISIPLKLNDLIYNSSIFDFPNRNIIGVSYESLNNEILFKINNQITVEKNKIKTNEELFLKSDMIKQKLLYFGKCKFFKRDYEKEYNAFLNIIDKKFINHNFFSNYISLDKKDYQEKNNNEQTIEENSDIDYFIPWYNMDIKKRNINMLDNKIIDTNYKEIETNNKNNESISDYTIDSDGNLWMNGDIMPKAYVKRLNLKK